MPLHTMLEGLSIFFREARLLKIIVRKKLLGQARCDSFLFELETHGTLLLAGRAHDHDRACDTNGEAYLKMLVRNKRSMRSGILRGDEEVTFPSRC